MVKDVKVLQVPLTYAETTQWTLGTVMEILKAVNRKMAAQYIMGMEKATDQALHGITPRGQRRQTEGKNFQNPVEENVEDLAHDKSRRMNVVILLTYAIDVRKVTVALQLKGRLIRAPQAEILESLYGLILTKYLLKVAAQPALPSPP